MPKSTRSNAACPATNIMSSPDIPTEPTTHPSPFSDVPPPFATASPLPSTLESQFTLLYTQLHDFGRTLHELTSSYPLIKETPKMQNLADLLEQRRVEARQLVGNLHERMRVPFTITEKVAPLRKSKSKFKSKSRSNVDSKPYPSATLQARAHSTAPLFLKGIIPQTRCQTPASGPLHPGLPYQLHVTHNPEGDYSALALPFKLSFTPDPHWVNTDPLTGQSVLIPGVVIGAEVDEGDGKGRIWGAYRERIWKGVGKEGEEGVREVRVPMSIDADEDESGEVGVEVEKVRTIIAPSPYDPLAAPQTEKEQEAEKGDSASQSKPADAQAASSISMHTPPPPPSTDAPHSENNHHDHSESTAQLDTGEITAAVVENANNGETDTNAPSKKLKSKLSQKSEGSSSVRTKKRKRNAIENQEREEVNENNKNADQESVSAKRRRSKRAKA